MAKIKVTSKCELYDGMSITFKAPCASNAVDGLKVYYNGKATTFSFRDSHGNNVSGASNLFASGAYIKAVLNTTNGYAHILNADTNAYLEGKIDAKASTATFSVSVPYSGWSSSNGIWSKKVTVSGILATDNPLADVVLGSDAATNEKYLDAWKTVQRIVTSANAVTIYTKGDPEYAFNMQLKVVR